MPLPSLVDQMYDQLECSLAEVLEREKIFKLGAQMVKKSYDALRAEGFTDEQALRIVAGRGLPFSIESK